MDIFYVQLTAIFSILLFQWLIFCQNTIVTLQQKHVFLVTTWFSVHTQSSGITIQPGFQSYLEKSTSTKKSEITGERVIYLVREKRVQALVHWVWTLLKQLSYHETQIYRPAGCYL